MKPRLFVLAGVLAFAAALGVAAGQRLSQEALVTIVGVVAGAAASIPTSLFIVWVTRRADCPPPPPPERDLRPQIIVMPSPLPGAAAPAYLSLTTPPIDTAGSPRLFTVIGGDETWPNSDT